MARRLLALLRHMVLRARQYTDGRRDHLTKVPTGCSELLNQEVEIYQAYIERN